MTDAFARIRDALVSRTGHAYYVDKERLLASKLRERLGALAFADFDRYESLLNSGEGEAEWRALEDAITIGETYFFRYPDHFTALRNQILPQLIEARQDVRGLRIWSIGCSTGPEPYSVAILLRELLGAEIDAWRISIIGGDISERALSAARTGEYGNWALRTLGPPERALYFDRVDARTWRLKAPYRTMVRFERQNLTDLLSPTPPLAWNGFDLILCRNVLIYFAPDRAVAMSAALKQRLAPGGTLLLGHAEATLLAEPSFPYAADFDTHFGAPLPALSAPPQAPAFAWTPAVVAPRRTEPTPDIAALELEPGEDASGDIEQLRTLADAGEYQNAAALCETLIAREPTSALLRYYEALLDLVTDDPAGAESALRKALYLDRNFILAHYRLGLLLIGRKDEGAGKRELAIAAQLAALLPKDALVPYGHGVSASGFGAAVRAVLDEAA